jgi:hypothetical protein
MEFLPLEKAVIERLLAEDDPTLETLRTQMQAAYVTSRKLTGVGFFTDISIYPENRPLKQLPSFVFGDVEASIEGLQHGAGFLLYVKQGFLSMLEGYCYSERWPETIVTTFHLTYHSGVSRDLIRVSRAWNGTRLGTGQ